MRTDLLKKKSDIEQWITEGRSKAFMARELNCNPKTINPLLKRLGLEYQGNQSGKGLTKNKIKWNLEEYLSNSTDIQSNKIRKKLLEEGYKEYKCECCGNSEWLG